MSRTTPARKLRDWTLAVAVALTVQGLAFLLMISGGRDVAPLPEYPAIEVAMVRPDEPPPEPPKASAPPASPPPARLAARPLALPTTVQPLPVPVGDGPVSAGPAQAAALAAPRPLQYGCLGKSIPKLKGEERYRCQDEVHAILDRPGRERRGDLQRPVDPEKTAGYAATARRQAYMRSGASQLGNASSMGCAHSNLGVGCPDDMLLPLVTATSQGVRVKRHGSDPAPGR